MLPVGPGNFPPAGPKNNVPCTFLCHHEKDRIFRTTLLDPARTGLTLPIQIPPPPLPQLEMVRNGPQSLDANDVMVNAWGLPGGVLKIPIDRRITSNEGSCVKVVSCFFLR